MWKGPIPNTVKIRIKCLKFKRNKRYLYSLLKRNGSGWVVIGLYPNKDQALDALFDVFDVREKYE